MAQLQLEISCLMLAINLDEVFSLTALCAESRIEINECPYTYDQPVEFLKQSLNAVSNCTSMQSSLNRLEVSYGPPPTLAAYDSIYYDPENV